jgi:hypothetical protein
MSILLVGPLLLGLESSSEVMPRFVAVAVEAEAEDEVGRPCLLSCLPVSSASLCHAFACVCICIHVFVRKVYADVERAWVGSLSLSLSLFLCFFAKRENKCFVHCGFSYHGSRILVPCRNGRRNGSHLVACVDHRGGETR